MKNKYRLTTFAAIVITTSTASAGQTPMTTSPTPADDMKIHSHFGGDWLSDIGVGAQFGTLGAGIHFDYHLPMAPVYLRLSGNYFEFSDTLDLDDIDYDGDIKLSTLGLTVNYLPFGDRGFKIIAGGYFGQNQFSGRATARDNQGAVTVGDNQYVFGPADSIIGTASFNTFTPYVGIGWDWVFGPNDNYVFGIEAGVRFMGSADVTLRGTGQFAEGQPAFADLNAEQRNFEQDIEDYKYYPVLNLSFTYRF